jgi:ligand-binding sensor domain-containing protein
MRAVISIASTDNAVLAGTAFGYFGYQPTSGEIITKTKSSGLSQVDLQLVSKDPNSNKLLVAYRQSDLDLIEGDQIRNLPDLMISNVREDRTINHINWIGSDAYLSTNMGIVVVNTERFEIKNTYRIGRQGAAIKVFQTVLLNGILYAATENGLIRANFNSSSLNDFRNWTNDPILNQISSVDRIINCKNQLVLQRHDSLIVNRNGSWNFLFTNQKPITTLAVVNDRLFVGQSNLGKGTALLIDPTTQVMQVINSNYLTYPTDAVVVDGVIWVGDLNNGLVNISNPSAIPVYPETPAGLAYGEGNYAEETIFVASGKISNQPVQSVLRNGIFTFANGNWKSITAANFPFIDSVRDIQSVVYSKSIGSIYASSENRGLIEITKDNAIKIYNRNSFISSQNNNPNVFSIGGLVIDRDQHLWLTNSGAQQGLVVKKNDGAIQKFTIPFVYSNLGLSKIVVDDLNRKWIATSNSDGLFCFDQGSSLESVTDDRWRYFKQGLGRGNLPSNKIISMASDRNGFLWIGTDKGVAVIQCGEDLFNSTACEAILPVVQQDNFAGRLLAEEQINDIKIDGADRKWIATNNGVWLLSADGQKVINQFTSSNSKLLDNQVFSIVVDPQSGEVFFMTKKGICSFRGTSTDPIVSIKKPFVFPNPVPPGFSGTIAIRDLPENAWVSITELDGRLVYKTRSLGGQAIWNGKNYKGEKVSSGTYLILVSNEFNTQQVAGKIFFLK